MNQIKNVQPIRDKEQLENMKCPERDYILFLIGINTGLRVGDLLQLKVSDVKRKKRIMVKEGKKKETNDSIG